MAVQVIFDVLIAIFRAVHKPLYEIEHSIHYRSLSMMGSVSINTEPIMMAPI